MRKPHLALAFALLMAAGAASADALADLKGALARATATTPIKASVEARIWRRVGEGAKADEESGQAALQVEDGARGFSTLYGKEVLARIDSELLARARNPNSKVPTQGALRELTPANLLPMLSAAPSLLRGLEKAQFKSERGEIYQGKPARVLTFHIPIETLSERDRKYAKRFEAVLDIWIDAGGTPLASRLRQKVSGRAFVVVSFDTSFDEDNVYSLMGDRLFVVRREIHSKAAGAGEKDENKIVRTVQVLP